MSDTSDEEHGISSGSSAKCSEDESSDSDIEQADPEVKQLFLKTLRAVLPVAKKYDILSQRFVVAKQIPEVNEFAQRQISRVRPNQKYDRNSQEITSKIEKIQLDIEEAKTEDAINKCNWIIRRINDPYGDRGRDVMFEMLNKRASLFRNAGYFAEEVKDKLHSYQYFGVSTSALRRWKPANQVAGGQENNPFLSLLDDMDQRDEYLDPCNDFYSKSMEQHEQEGRGRFVVAKEKIETGTLLIREKAYAVIVEKGYLKLICNRCLTPVKDQPYPCPR